MRRYIRLLSLSVATGLAVSALAVAGPSLASPPNRVLTISPTHINFGRVTVGDTSSAYVTISNNSTDTRYYCKTATLGGSSNAPFYVGDSGWYDCWSQGIAPGETATIEIEFIPTEVGRFTSTDGSLQIGDAPTGGGSVVADFALRLSGTGVAESSTAGGVTAKPSKVSFGGVKFYSPAWATVTVTNNTGYFLYGTVGLSTGDSIGYSNFGCGGIAVGGTCTFDLGWLAASPMGKLSGTFTIDYVTSALDGSKAYSLEIPWSASVH